ncbi:MAG: hypothetical protein ACO3EH_00455 [Ilumatobacteraceae bacterium]
MTKKKTKKPQMGRPLKGDEPRSVPLFVRVTETTMSQINAIAKRRSASQADVVMAAVDTESRLPV